MTGEKENKEFYQAACREIHASKHLLRKVEAMGKEYHQERGKRILRGSCGAVAALALALISSNMISYAATGSPWIITVTTSDGRVLPSEPGTYELDGTVYTVKYTLEEKGSEGGENTAGTEATVSKSIETEGESSSSDNPTDLSEDSRVVREGEHIYLDIDGVCRIDVTESFANGSCEGTFERNGTEYRYRITGSPEDNTIRVNAEE